MHPSLISIIIPVYNREKELQNTFGSIERQTHNNVEVIVVDDGSSSAISYQLPAKSYSFVHQDHRGAPAARNYGFSQSHGEYVIFWDADVVGGPQMLEKMLQALNDRPDASYVYSNYRFGSKLMRARSFDADRLKKMNYIMTTSLMRRASFVGFDESLKRFQDWDLWLTMMEKGSVGVYIPETLFSVTPHRSGISHWLPRFAYTRPWRYLPGIRTRVDAYERARAVIWQKHHIDLDIVSHFS